MTAARSYDQADAKSTWWHNCGEIARLLRFLRDGDGLELADAIAIVEKPWHWDVEYRDMCDQQAAERAIIVEREMRSENGAIDAEAREMITDCEEP